VAISRRTILSISLGVVILVVVLLAIAGFAGWWRSGTLASDNGRANVQIVNLNAVHTEGYIFTIHYVISGRAVNSGGSTSNPVVILITITDDSGNALYTTTTSPEPSILQPGQEAPFYKQITSDDLGGYKGSFRYEASVQQQ